MLCETNSFALLYLAHLLGHILGAVESPTGRLVGGIGPGLLGVPVAIVCMDVTSLSIIPCHCQISLYRGIPKMEMPLELPGCRCSRRAALSQHSLRSPEQLNVPDPSLWIQRCLSVYVMSIRSRYKQSIAVSFTAVQTRTQDGSFVVLGWIARLAVPCKHGGFREECGLPWVLIASVL